MLIGPGQGPFPRSCTINQLASYKLEVWDECVRKGTHGSLILNSAVRMPRGRTSFRGRATKWSRLSRFCSSREKFMQDRWIDRWPCHELSDSMWPWIVWRERNKLASLSLYLVTTYYSPNSGRILFLSNIHVGILCTMLSYCSTAIMEFDMVKT